MAEGTGEEEMSAIDTFQAFWIAYPARVGVKARKQEALQAWLKLKPDDALYAELMAGLTRYKKVCGDFPVDAVRFLKHRRWEDEIAEAPPPDRSVGAVQADAMEQRAREVIEGHKAAEHTASPMPAQLRKMFGGRREEGG